MEHIHPVIETLTDSAVLLDKAGRIVEWNNNATLMFGYPRKEVLGRSLNLIYRQNYPFPQIIQETLQQQKKWMAETDFIRKNGISGVCKTVATLLPLPNNKPQALIVHHNITSFKQIESQLQSNNKKTQQELQYCLDLFLNTHDLLMRTITTCEQTEKKLKESELRFHLLAENSTDIISRHAPDGTYLYISPSCKTWLGYTPQELMNQNIYKLLHHDEMGKLKRIFNRKKDLPNYPAFTFRMRRKGGDYNWFESNIRIIRDETTNNICEIHLAARNVTDRILDKKARLRGQQLAHVFRLNTMEEMASGMAHEINQPLAAVVNYTQGCVRYLKNETHNPSELLEIMNKAVYQAERAGEIIHRLKNFFCKGELFKSSCKINSLIKEAVSLIRNELKNSKTKIEFNLAKDSRLISIDKIQIQQVILNLLQNAIEAMKEIEASKRRIFLQSKATYEKVEITVKDTGPGFSKEMVHKIFEPFFTTKAHGRGMGLAICRSIIEAHGGQFLIHPNSSTCSSIRFILPIN